MPRADTSRNVVFPGRGRPADQALQEGPMRILADGAAQGIEDAGGRWTSMVVRDNEDPPSAAIHFVLGGKRYVAVVQPLDMPNRTE